MAAAESSVVFTEFDCGLASGQIILIDMCGRSLPTGSLEGNKVNKAKLFFGKTGCEWKQRCLEVAERECRIQGMLMSVFISYWGGTITKPRRR